MEWVGSRNRKARGVSGQVWVYSVSLVGGRPVGVGIGMVTPGGYSCDVNVGMSTVLVN